MMQNEGILIIKVKKDSSYERTFHKQSGTYDISSSQDKEIYENNFPNERFELVILFFDNLQSKGISELRIAQCEKSGDYTFSFKILGETKSKLKIENFKKLLMLDIKDDFEQYSYMVKECALGLFEDLKKAVLFKKEIVYSCNENKEWPELNSFNFSKCDDKDAILMHVREEIISDNDRNEFQRDKDRIIHSKAYRRLVDKAQIFSASKGDHFRMRMTHTNEVSQIARSISRRLKLNEDLTEAIALGHDIGHTPFGHQGERTLDAILSGKENVIKNINDVEGLKQRFKHNYQSLRVLTYLENKYTEYPGLNLSYQVMEGIWKHTRTKAKEGEVPFDIKDFFKYEHEEYLYPEIEHSVTLEGQVVAIADEIAQRSHDIDDAFNSGKLTYADFLKYCNTNKTKKLTDIYNEIEGKISYAEEKNITITDKEDMYRAQLTSKIIGYFINDVVKATEKKIKKIKMEKVFCAVKIVDFSNEGKLLNEHLEKLITKKVINSSEVANFDVHAHKIVKKLFEHYYNNPLCLDETTKVRLYNEMLLNFENCISINDGEHSLVRNELTKIKDMDLKNGIDDVEEYMRKRKVYTRVIADYISGMTDSYALKQYKEII